MKAFINGREIQICNALVFTAPFQKKTTANYTIAKFDGSAKLKIEFDKKVESVEVRPLRYDLHKDITGDRTVEIDLTQNCNISVEINGSAEDCLLFYGGMSPNVDKNNYSNIIYFDSGEHFADVIKIEKDNTLVYLDDGAVVNGKIDAER